MRSNIHTFAPTMTASTPASTPASTAPTAIAIQRASETRRLVAAWLVALAVLFGGTVAWILIVRPPNAAWIWGEIVGLASVPGKYLIFSTLIPKSPLTTWEVVVLATATDIAIALTLAVGLGWAERLPGIARTLKRIHDRAQEVLTKFPRLQRMAFWGVVLFVFLPLPASGAIGGTFVGQFLGLTRSMGVVAVTLGGVLVSLVFATLAIEIGKQAQEIIANKWVTAASVVVFAVFAWWAWKRIRVTLEKG
jgi:uncharacterized membrane protein